MVTPVCQQWRYNSLVLIHRYQGFKITVWLLNQMIFHIPSETNWISFLIQKYCQYVLDYEPYLTRTKCPFSIMPSYQCGDNMIITLSNRYEENIHCDAIIIGSISSKFLTTDTPLDACEGEVWGVFGEFKVLFMFHVCHCIVVFNIVLYLMF